ncbi:MAG TPA: thiamine phosphate synthase [Solirubrobacteraceae bacterium]|nr:thiamine phosphate synthase [Solirubrobacteraceae bacterium]
MPDRLTRLSRARLYLVCAVHDDAFIAAALRGGVDIVQLRDKTSGDDAIVVAGRRYRRLCDAAGALLIVNDRPDLAVACGADGVHVGQDDTAVAQAREVVGEDALIGLSTHTPAQIDAAAGADYIGVGPVHATPTKPGRPAVGLELVRYAAAHATVPFFAIGGIDAPLAAQVAGAGATRIAVVRAITEAGDPQAAAAALRAAISAEAPVGAT